MGIKTIDRIGALEERLARFSAYWDSIHVGVSILGKASARRTMLAWLLGFPFWTVSLLFA